MGCLVVGLPGEGHPWESWRAATGGRTRQPPAGLGSPHLRARLCALSPPEVLATPLQGGNAIFLPEAHQPAAGPPSSLRLSRVAQSRRLSKQTLVRGFLPPGLCPSTAVGGSAVPRAGPHLRPPRGPEGQLGLCPISVTAPLSGATDQVETHLANNRAEIAFVLLLPGVWAQGDVLPLSFWVWAGAGFTRGLSHLRA